MATAPEISTKFTEGPWYVTGEDDRRYIREEASDACIALMLDGGHINPAEAMPEDEIAANCRLIAAAPELHAALERILGECAHDAQIYKIVTTALAKVRGK